MFKLGIGQDSHQFEKGKKLMLAGVHIPNHHGLKANSDGDVILHSLFNALSSALGLKSISNYADKMHSEGITDSTKYFKPLFIEMEKRNYKINNISISIECKTPKIDPHVDKMKDAIANLFNIKKDNIGITTTSGESLTSFGEGKGIQSISCILLEGDKND